MRGRTGIQMNILVHGGHFVNKGAEAMLRTVQAELGRRLDRATFWFLNYPIHTTLREVQLAESAELRLASSRNLGRQAAALAWGMLSRAAVRRAAFYSPVAAFTNRHHDEIDAGVDVSGFAFGDEWGPAAAKRTLPIVRYCAATVRPWIFLPQAWGPFTRPEIANRVREFLQRAALVYARDEQSHAHLDTLLRGSSTQIQRAPDIAFRFQSGEPQVGAEVLRAAGLPVGRQPFIGVVPNMRVYERSPGSGLDNGYVKCLLDLVRHGVRELGAVVVLVPHEIKYGDRAAPDDRYLCRLLRDGCAGDGLVTALVDEYSAAAIKSVIGHLSLLIGSRYHAIVAALSLGIPAVVMGWSHKYAELMRSVGLERYLLDYREIDPLAARQMLADAWARRQVNGAMVESYLGAILRDVDAVFDRVAERLRRAHRNPS